MMNTRPHVTSECSTCGSEELISVSLQEGEVYFWTCTHCEAKGWEREGLTVSRDSVLELIPRR